MNRRIAFLRCCDPDETSSIRGASAGRNPSNRGILVSNRRIRIRRLPAVVRGFGAVVAIAAVGAVVAGCAPAAQAAEVPQVRSDATQLKSLQVPADQAEPATPHGPVDPTGAAGTPPVAKAPVAAPGAGHGAVPAVQAPAAPAGPPAAGGHHEPPAGGPHDHHGPPAGGSHDHHVGTPGAPTVVLKPGGQGGRVLYVAPSWQQPDLNGGELVHYHVVITDANGVVVRDTTTRDLTVPRYEGERCVAPYKVEVSAVTRTPRTDRTWTGPAGTATVGHGCPVNMAIEGGLTSPQDIGIQLHETGPFDPEVSVKCDLLANDAVVWSGYCGTFEQGGEEGQYIGYSGLELETEYAIVLRVEQFVGGPTMSNTITLTTPAS
jgi:hypothetical protein